MQTYRLFGTVLDGLYRQDVSAAVLFLFRAKELGAEAKFDSLLCENLVKGGARWLDEHAVSMVPLLRNLRVHPRTDRSLNFNHRDFCSQTRPDGSLQSGSDECSRRMNTPTPVR